MKKTVLFTLLALAASASAQNYKVTNKFILGGEGGWDYLTYDTQGHRLFITRGDHVMVIDPKDGKQIGDIPAHRCHGVALDYDHHRGFISNGGAGTITVFDLSSLKPIQDVQVGENPDAIIYDGHAKKVVVMNGRSKNVMVVDPQLLKIEATIDLTAKPEFAAADSGHVYVNLEDTSQIAQIDSKTWKLESKWMLKSCESPSGLAMDEENERLFSVCDGRVMNVLNAKDGKIAASVPIGEGPDAAAFDPGRKLAFSSNGRSGNLTVVKEESPNKFTVAETLETQRGARTMALDPQTGIVYLVTAEFEPSTQPGQRPTIKPGTFTVLVVAPQ
jgi:DNA-binding beta-propeller fold protein YncE